MPELSDEDRQRIYDEERVRAEAKAHFASQGNNNIQSCCIVLAVLFVISLVMGGGCLHSASQDLTFSSSQRGSSSSAPETPSNFDASYMAHEFVTKRLKAPSTADFSSESDEQITYLHNDPPTFRVTGWVDSQNSFGAKLRSSWIVKLHKGTGDEWTADSVDILTP